MSEADTERIKNKVTELVLVVTQICHDLDIKYCLSGETALFAYRDGKINDYPEIAINIKDAARLIFSKQLVDKGLMTESLLTDPAHAVFGMEIYDPATIDFNAADYFRHKNNCLQVKVVFLRNKKPAKALKRIASAGIVTQRKLKSDSLRISMGKRLFRMLGSIYGDLSGSVISGNKTLQGPVIADDQAIEIDGNKYDLPRDTERYMACMFGKDWGEYTVKMFEESQTAFRDIDHSWKEYSKRLATFDTKGYIKARETFKPLNEKFKEARDDVEQYYSILERTHARITLWKQYHSKKDLIKELYAQNKMEELADILRDYLDEMIRFKKSGLGLCFDPEILEIACAVLKYQGNQNLADEIKAMVPKEHMTELVIKDYNQ